MSRLECMRVGLIHWLKRITGFADMIQLTHLKLQQVMSRMVPDGVYLRCGWIS
jgi:hypothetical protein